MSKVDIVHTVCPRMKPRSFSTVFQLARARSLPLSTTQRVDSDGTYDATSDDETRTNDHDDDGNAHLFVVGRLFTRSRRTSDDERCAGSVRKALGFARRDDVAWTPRLARGGCATPMTTMETRVDDSLSSDVRACIRRRASVRWVDGRMCTTASSSAHR